MTAESAADSSRRHRPKATTVFVAAFIAGAVAAVVVNRMLDLHLAQAKPQVESEPIFVSLRPMPQGAPVTVWDVALRDWPRAMLPSTALRASDSFEGSILKYPVREGQPLLSVHLLPATAAAATPAAVTEEAFVPPSMAPSTPPPPARRTPEPDLWTPDGTATTPATTPERAPRETISFAVVPLEEPVAEEQPVAEPVAEAVAEALARPPAVEPLVTEPHQTPAEPVVDAVVAAEPSLAPGDETADATADEPRAAAQANDDVALSEAAPDAAADQTPVENAPEQAEQAGVPTLVAIEPLIEPTPAPDAGQPARISAPPARPATVSGATMLKRRDSDLPLPGPLAPEPYPGADVPPQRPVDLDSLPSVMARSDVDVDVDPGADPPPAGNLRYLVVPERIARQADTMFAPPVAAEPKAVADPIGESLPPVVPNVQAPVARPQVSASQAHMPSGQRTGQRPAATTRPLPAVPPVKEAPRSPGRPAPLEQPAREDDRSRSALGPRAWGGMFPNVAAGIEAMGTRWRGEERSAAEPRQAPQQRR
jgi:hypothetical protein